MYISRLRLRGFKSFGGTHDIELSPGYTAIVGPNGSGKSNILDGIRWVLEDPAPAKLRIQKQSDLLFQGSISLPPASDAEVSLQLSHNSNLITLKRAYSIENGTMLSVDGRKIRLQDLDDIKTGIGLEGEQFAFIGQGEIAEVIRQRASQRRIHLESLFGIDKYRKKRDDAAQKLGAASNELLRLQTLMSELHNRKTQIEPQVRKALEVKSILLKLEKYRSDYYFSKRAVLEDDLHALLEKNDEIGNSIASGLFWAKLWEKALSTYKKNKEILQTDLANAKSSVEAIQESRKNLFRQCFGVANALRNSCERITSLASEEEKINLEMDVLAGDLETAVHSTDQLVQELGVVNAELASVKDEYQKQCKLYEEEERLREKQKKHWNDILQSKDKITAKLRRLVIDLRNSNLRIKSLEEEVANLHEHLDKEKGKSEIMETESLLVKEEHSQVYAECRNLSGKLQIMRKEQRELDSHIEDLRSNIEDHGYPDPVRFIVSASKLGKIEVAPIPVIEAFSAPATLAQALESFLGGRLFWLLVDKADEAQICIDLLKKRGFGRVTMLPLEKCKPRLPQNVKLDDYDGIIGWAINEISVEEKWMPALKHLLGDVLFVDSFSNARLLAVGSLHFPVVTLDGEVFSPQGTISGGFRRKGPGIVEQKLTLEREKELLRAGRVGISRLSEELEEREKEETALAAKEESINIRLADLKAGIKQTGITLSSFRSELDEAKARIKNQKEDILSGWKIRRDLQRQFKSIEGKFSEDGNNLDFLSNLKVRLAEKQNRIEVLTEKRKSASAILGRIKEEKKRSERRHVEIVSESNDLRRKTVDFRRQLSENGLLGKRLWLQLKEREKKTSLLLDLLKVATDKISYATSRYDRVGDLLRIIEKNRDRLLLQRNSVEKEIEHLNDLWGDKFPEPENVSSVYSDLNLLQNNIRLLEKQIRGYGDIDQGCLSEDASLKERISYLESQIRDVTAGAGELKDMISKLDIQVERIFRTALKRVDERFYSLFKRLFGGGEAHMTIQDGESIWDCGVDIFARPPGKKMQSLNQLSGGEQSLTAVSLLFASMEVAEVPLAILDEVDAALDDINLDRFVGLILDYSSALQLLIMTHRRITMEKASIMYGVTMREPGLSQILGVRLDDWK